MGKRSRVDRRVWAADCPHPSHQHGGPGGLHVWCCHFRAGVEVVDEDAGLRARFFGAERPPAHLVELVEGLALVRRQLAG